MQAETSSISSFKQLIPLHALATYTKIRIIISFSAVFIFIQGMRLLIIIFRPDIIDAENRVKDCGYIKEEYDFVIVGAGAAGCVLANRLSEVSGWNILLLEAGRDEPVLSDLPLLFPSLQLSPLDWQFKTVPQKEGCRAMKDNQCLWPRGKALGGTTVINAMLYVRGNKADYNNWSNLGNLGWDYESVLPYFKKSEDLNVPVYNSSYHSRGGYLTVEHFCYNAPITPSFLEAGQELGFDIVDLNGEKQTGFTVPQTTTRNCLRVSAAKAFLRPIKDRKNLDICMNTYVEKVLIRESNGTKRAYGVVYNRNNKRGIVRARKEVILSAGAIQSPMLLMLSGIGPREHLEQLGINVIKDLRVGDNLMDHISLGGFAFLIDEPVGFVLPRTLLDPRTTLNFIFRNRGPFLQLPVSESLAFIPTKYANSSELPDIELLLASFCDSTDGGVFGKRIFGLTDEFYAQVFEPIVYKDCFSAIVVLEQPESRGWIRLKSKNPYDCPLIDPNYFAEKIDVDRLVEGAKFVLKLSQTKALQKYGARPNPNKFLGCEEFEFLSDEYLACCVKHYSLTLWHFSGTCKMGPSSDPNAVVDENLSVYGIDSLRVVDTSIMPIVTHGHTAYSTVMIAEKESDVIKAKHGNDNV